MSDADKKLKLTVKVDAAMLELWREAAHIRRTTLSNWVRNVLTATATKTKKESLDD